MVQSTALRNMARFLIWLVTLWLAQLAFGVDQIGQMSVERPALLNIFTHEEISDSMSRFSVLVSSYNPEARTTDPAYVLVQPGLEVENNFTEVVPKPFYSFFNWPKDIAQVPTSVLGVPAIVTADGSNITGKTSGAIYLTDMSDFAFPSTTDISSGLLEQPWGYGKILWMSINNDGREDILTCRWQYENDFLQYSQLVWLNQPLQDPMTSTWTLGVLKESACDMSLALMQVQDSSRNDWDIVYTTGLRTRKLAFFWAENTVGNPGNWDDPDQIMGAVLDSEREFFDVHVADLNKDGVDDILVTVTANDGGSVEVFIAPPVDDFRNPALYTKVTLASGFVSRYGGQFGRSPSVARVFYPTAAQTMKPWILLAGENDGRGYYLTPNSEDPTDWTYQLHTIVDKGPDQQVYGVTVVDIDGDGYADAFFSIQTNNTVEVFSFAP